MPLLWMHGTNVWSVMWCTGPLVKQDSSSDIPPHNKDATVPEDVYSLNDSILRALCMICMYVGICGVFYHACRLHLTSMLLMLGRVEYCLNTSQVDLGPCDCFTVSYSFHPNAVPCSVMFISLLMVKWLHKIVLETIQWDIRIRRQFYFKVGWEMHGRITIYDCVGSLK